MAWGSKVTGIGTMEMTKSSPPVSLVGLVDFPKNLHREDTTSFTHSCARCKWVDHENCKQDMMSAAGNDRLLEAAQGDHAP